VSQQGHGLQTHAGPPLLHRLHELLLRLAGVRGEPGPAAPAEAQQVHGEDGLAPGESVQVLSPEAHAAAEPVEQDQGRFAFDAVAAEAQGPQLVAVGDGDMPFGEGTFYT